MTVDVHVHLVGISPAHGCYLSPHFPQRGLGWIQPLVLGLSGTDRTGFDRRARRRLYRRVAGSGLDAVGLLALDGAYDARGRFDEHATGLLVSNDYLFEVARDSPRYRPIPSINPQRRDALDELERVAELGAAAVKVLPNAQHFDPSDRRHRPFWRRLAALRLPLVAHTGIEFTLPQHGTAVGAPERLRPALDEGLVVIAAHSGTSGGRGYVGHFRQWMALIEAYPNLYGDLSALVSPARLPFARRLLADAGARERLVLGSDYPVPVTPALLAPWIGLGEALRLQRVRNPLRRNVLALRALGMDAAVEARGAALLRPA